MVTPPPNAYTPGTKLTVGSHQATIIKYISQGGFAHVYVCNIEPPFHGSLVACLKRVAVPNKWELTLLRQEVDAMRRLRGNKHIVSYIDSHASRMGAPSGGVQQYEVFLIMEYCENGGLIDFMNQRLTNKLTEPEIINIMYECTIAIAMCHHLQPPLIHRDIKIENVLIDKYGTFKICDFGSSVGYIPAPGTPQELAAVRDDLMQHTTPQYRAPEMIDLLRGFPIDDKLDIWALGIFCYKLCYYTTPFELHNQKTMQDLENDILKCSTILRFKDLPGLIFSPRLKNVIKCCLREDPRRRPNATQLLQELCSMKGVPVPNVIPYSVSHHQPQPQIKDAVKLPPKDEVDQKKDPFASIDKSKIVRRPQSMYIENSTPNKSMTSIQDYVQLQISYDNQGQNHDNHETGVMDFLRSKEEERTAQRHDTGGSFKASFMSGLRKISTGGSINSVSSNHTSGSTVDKKKRGVKKMFRGHSPESDDEAPPQNLKPQHSFSKTRPSAATSQTTTAPKKLSIQKRMLLLLKSHDTPTESEYKKTARGYGRFTDVAPESDMQAINKLPSPEDGDRRPPRVPSSLSSKRTAEPKQPLPAKSNTLLAIPKPAQQTLAPPKFVRSSTVVAKKVPPKPNKPSHLKSPESKIPGSKRRTSNSSDMSMPDLDDLEKQFARRFPSYV